MCKDIHYIYIFHVTRIKIGKILKSQEKDGWINHSTFRREKRKHSLISIFSKYMQYEKIFMIRLSAKNSTDNILKHTDVFLKNP